MERVTSNAIKELITQSSQSHKDTQSNNHDMSRLNNFKEKAVTSMPVITSIEPKVNHNDDDGFANVSYTLSAEFHCLEKTELYFTLPEIHIKEKYQGLVEVSWIENLQSNVMVSGKLSGDEVIIGDEVTPHSSVIFSDMLVKQHTVEHLDSWYENFIPRMKVNFMPPWLYNFPCALDFPIYKFYKVVLKHECTFHRNPFSLLRVRNIEDGEYYSVSQYSKYLEIPDRIDLPKMLCRYVNYSESYIESLTKNDSQPNNRFIYPCKYLQPVSLNNQILTPNSRLMTAPIVCRSHVLAWFWTLNNISSAKKDSIYNESTLYGSKNPAIYSNYYKKDGEMPETTFTIRNKDKGDSVFVNNITNIMCRGNLMLSHFPHYPSKHHFNLYPFCYRADNFDYDTSMDTSMFSLVCNITIDENESIKGEQYFPILYALVQGHCFVETNSTGISRSVIMS